MTTSTPYLPSSILIPADIDRRAAFEAVYIVRVGRGQSVQKLIMLTIRPFDSLRRGRKALETARGPNVLTSSCFLAISMLCHSASANTRVAALFTTHQSCLLSDDKIFLVAETAAATLDSS